MNTALSRFQKRKFDMWSVGRCREIRILETFLLEYSHFHTDRDTHIDAHTDVYVMYMGGGNIHFHSSHWPILIDTKEYYRSNRVVGHITCRPHSRLWPDNNVHQNRKWYVPNWFTEKMLNQHKTDYYFVFSVAF